MWRRSSSWPPAWPSIEMSKAPILVLGAYGLGRVPVGPQLFRVEAPPATKLILCHHPSGHHPSMGHWYKYHWYNLTRQLNPLMLIYSLVNCNSNN